MKCLRKCVRLVATLNKNKVKVAWVHEWHELSKCPLRASVLRVVCGNFKMYVRWSLNLNTFNAFNSKLVSWKRICFVHLYVQPVETQSLSWCISRRLNKLHCIHIAINYLPKCGIPAINLHCKNKVFRLNVLWISKFKSFISIQSSLQIFLECFFIWSLLLLLFKEMSDVQLSKKENTHF